MNALENMNKAMEYIEQNLLDNIDYSEMARVSGSSEYHFRRVFSFLAGMSLGEYIRLRKLSVATTFVNRKELKVIDISLMLGYESPDAFSKAFHAFHGVSPSAARKENTPLKTFPPMTFQLTIKGGNTMNYRIVEKEGFYIIGFKKRITLQFNGENSQINALVERLTPDIIQELKSISNIEPKGIINVSTNFSDRTNEGSELDQYLGVATTQSLSSSKYDELYVAPLTWAVFTCVGEYPTELQQTWSRIYSEWLPSSDYQLCEGPEILWNEGPDTSKPQYKSEIWIPVIQKA